ncbi:Serine_threonine-protein kinase PknD [Streptomyces sp. enrichment culture]
MGRMGTEGAGGRVIAGRYRLETVLGRGGMGVVWRATDQLLGRPVAVKELALDDSLSADERRRRRERTLREARAVAQLRHPHVIVVHDVVEHDERPYLVMEFIDGASLADRIAGRGPVDAHEAARIGVALLGALRTAHAAGVLHRDLKPANVLVENGSGRVVLTDFGVAQVTGTTTLTESGSFVGSPEYTAPERMSGSGTGAASDLWSLGALLCAAVSGESPFRRESLGAVVHAVLSDDLRLPVQAGPLLPVVRGLLERDPQRRLDAADAERMLRGFLDTGRTPQPQPEQRPGRGGRLAVALLVAAMAAAGLSAAALLVNGGGDGERPPAPTPSTSVSTPQITPSAPASSRPTRINGR